MEKIKVLIFPNLPLKNLFIKIGKNWKFVRRKWLFFKLQDWLYNLNELI